jgi:hypothetical protein
MCADILLERDSVTRFFASGFFHESSFSEPLKIRLGSFQIFPKILLGRYTTELLIFPRIKKNLNMALIGYSGAWEKLKHEKT